MSLDMLSACGWPLPGINVTGSHTNPPKVTLVQEQFGVDGSFLLANMLVNHLKANTQANSVLLIATHHTSAHYAGVCKKLAFNTEAAVKNHQLTMVDVLEHLYSQGGTTGALNLLQHIGQQMKEARQAHPSNLLVIVDDLTFYAVMHPSGAENPVIDFFDEQLSMASPSRPDHIVLKVNASECYGRLCAYLRDQAEVVVTLEPLSSGNFREVDGRFTVHRRERTATSQLELLEHHRTLLYKVGERQIRTYVPGELGIKNL
ncbi:uncharacterized protein LOC128731942 [Anopheles nili]|uniref:uncharacterized protein LOC128731942 n=1 Tax=Anopheles nili TaxID=185578 RepID=UPI00237AAD7B|nr:uncharacterized protein LOC128731942 [Anopheles nili]